MSTATAERCLSLRLVGLVGFPKIAYPRLPGHHPGADYLVPLGDGSHMK